MLMHMQFPMYIFLIFLLFVCSKVSSIPVNITTTQFLRDPDEVTSSNKYFKLGFFSPPNSTNRYVGIWYNTGSDAKEVVWVANRDNPLKDSSGVFKLSEDGNLQLLDGGNNLVWSSNLTYESISNSSVAQLSDTGNLVLLSNEGREIIWESFEHPTDTVLPLMKNGIYHKNKETPELARSWKSSSNPGSGKFTIGVTPSRRLAEGFIWNDGKPYWRSGPWNGNFFIGLPQMYYLTLLQGFTLENGTGNLPTLMFSSKDPSTRDHYKLTYDGVLLHKEWNESNKKWEVIWRSVDSDCDIYGKCGPFAKCYPRKSPICTCLEGFEPTNIEEWSNKNWTRGCSRKKKLQCKKDGFLRLKNVKVPDQAGWLAAVSEEECKRQCQERCECLAYAYYLGIGCMIWNETLIDIQEFNVNSVDLFVRVAHSVLADIKIKQRAVLAAGIISVTVALVSVAFFARKWRTQRKGSTTVIAGREAFKKEKPLYKSKLEMNETNIEFKDLPLFEFEKLLAATNNFDEKNKLGQGGFGPVFKGIMEDGQEIAVKRLSKASGQGMQEFMNEVLLISKLQHRNLVRLLGCCLEEEKMLVYEYMPNKSLDAHLFGPIYSSLKEQLDWKRRLNIIEGISRGLLYLHRDSRLRIIHRYLKAGNILLDEELNPKISDFGMAKTFGGKEDQGNTLRVVGTYGYMSPEYAMGGQFSEKSDVYSFGVLLLEIISGRRNKSFTPDDCCSGLLAYAWKLWNEDDILSLIDPTISRHSSFHTKITRCIHIGLLCVQDLPEERPTMSEIISMLDSESSDLRPPIQPGLIHRRHGYPHYSVSSNSQPCWSESYASVTAVGGR